MVKFRRSQIGHLNLEPAAPFCRTSHFPAPVADKTDFISFSTFVPMPQQLTEKACMQEVEDRTGLFIQGLFSKPSDLSCMIKCHYPEKGVINEIKKLFFSLALLQCPQCWKRQKIRITGIAKGCL